MIEDLKTKYPGYTLSIDDSDFLHREELRGTRLMLEYEKPELALRDQKIKSTIVVFGSARVMSPEQAEQFAAGAVTPEQKTEAKRRVRQAAWYQLAEDFGRVVSERGGALHKGNQPKVNVISTGGGPGLMEAANRGAHLAGAPSIGLNITLPFEEEPNPYSSPELTFRFNYFSIRKLHLVNRCAGIAIMPGGWGTLDELFDKAIMTASRDLCIA